MMSDLSVSSSSDQLLWRAWQHYTMISERYTMMSELPFPFSSIVPLREHVLQILRLERELQLWEGVDYNDDDLEVAVSSVEAIVRARDRLAPGLSVTSSLLNFSELYLQGLRARAEMEDSANLLPAFGFTQTWAELSSLESNITSVPPPATLMAVRASDLPAPWMRRIRAELNSPEFNVPGLPDAAPRTAGRAYDTRYPGLRRIQAALDCAEFNFSCLLEPATNVSRVSSNSLTRSSRDHLIVHIQELEEQEAVPTTAPTIQEQWMKLSAILRSKSMVITNRTQSVSNELLVGLIAATYQSLYQNVSMSMPNRLTRYVLIAANGSGFLFLLSGMLRRARKCNSANILIFFGILLAAAGIIFSLSIDIPGVLGWTVSTACLLLVMTAVIY